MLLGYFYARRFGPDMASANRLNLEIFTPALIFSVLSSEGFELTRYAELAFEWFHPQRPAGSGVSDRGWQISQALAA